MTGCPPPCTSTYVKTVYSDEKIYEETATGSSRIDIVFSETVNTRINDFPSFSFAKFLASFGGSFGLWLGLGVLQILQLSKSFFQAKIK